MFAAGLTCPTLPGYKRRQRYPIHGERSSTRTLSVFFGQYPMQGKELRRRVRDLAEPLAQLVGYEVVAVEWLTEAGGSILRVSLDGPKGVTAGGCARVSGRLSLALDEADPIETSYRLEVSSPGIDRPVQRLADFARFVGFKVRMKLVPGAPRKRFTGVIEKVEGDVITVTSDDGPHSFALDAVEKANLVLDLDEYQKLQPESSDVEPEADAAPEESDHDQQ